MPSFIEYNKFLIPHSYFLIIIVVQNFFFRNLSESFLLPNFYEISWNFSFKFTFGGSIIVFDFLLFQNCSIRSGTLLKFFSNCYKLYAEEKSSQRIKYSLNLSFLALITNIRSIVHSSWSSINIDSEIVKTLFFRL
jgi:hypothetical protein